MLTCWSVWTCRGQIIRNLLCCAYVCVLIELFLGIEKGLTVHMILLDVHVSLFSMVCAFYLDDHILWFGKCCFCYTYAIYHLQSSSNPESNQNTCKIFISRIVSTSYLTNKIKINKKQSQCRISWNRKKWRPSMQLVPNPTILTTKPGEAIVRKC